MRPLLIDDKVRADLRSLVQYAEENPLTMDNLLDIANKEADAQVPGDLPNYTRIVPVDYRVVFTIEQHHFGKIKHLSVSIPTKNKLPSPAACEMIMVELDFTKALMGCEIVITDIAPEHQCIDIMEIEHL